MFFECYQSVIRLDLNLLLLYREILLPSPLKSANPVSSRSALHVLPSREWIFFYEKCKRIKFPKNTIQTVDAKSRISPRDAIEPIGRGHRKCVSEQERLVAPCTSSNIIPLAVFPFLPPRIMALAPSPPLPPNE